MAIHGPRAIDAKGWNNCGGIKPNYSPSGQIDGLSDAVQRIAPVDDNLTLAEKNIATTRKHSDSVIACPVC